MNTTPPEAPSGPSGPGEPGPDQGPRVTGEEMRDLGRLRRTSFDRKIAGVAGGIARHFDIDPVIVRVVFVVLVFFGGAGLIVYGACWLLLPEDGQQHAKVRLDERSRTVALILVGTLALLALLGDSWGGWGFPWPLAVLGLVVFLVMSVRSPRHPLAGPPPTPTAPVSGPPAPPYPPTYPPTYAAAVRRERSDPRKRGPILVWYTVALIVLGLGTLGIADASGAEVGDSAYPALALGLAGVMLVVGSFYGRAGGLIVVGLVATLATAGATAADEWDSGRIDERPLTAAAVDEDYSLFAGEIYLDLSDVDDIAALDGRTITVEVLFGHVEVLLPAGLDANVDATIEAGGRTELFGSSKDGSDHATYTGSTAGPTVNIETEVVFGEIEVDSVERTIR